jgi:ABC-type multidrug transport system fused ATPase/permease subunit
MTNYEEQGMSLGDFFWSLLVFYFIFFYFMLLFRVIGDLFSDHETGGLVKTAWIVFLLFVPFIAIFTYLIVRGRGMSERSLARAQAAETAQQDYIRRTAGTPDDSTAKIAKAHELLTSGAITQPEFETLKAQGLA